ncbi:MAG TPA: nicotinate phosphoribosyltransferase [Nitrosomonas nitrosa]|uniref:Nicotinate phosphoribosyltransferase n=1 Tax=Nitrosomonas nitrosa TaxID=52442 RepID=A0A8H9DBC0_9PROT|nr:nicotinate phosphoribosyltransferase [Nitrosomonas nitrosa]CAE6514624.1 Nicotinate phosphoribosyltransferase pncB2 [Nitrosomonas nitrosa]HNP51495.1 nicotinate phosphoribosyltransferase [Nitrosomonas nitrosa]
MKINPFSSPLLADLYQFTMLQSYLEQGMQETAVFELFIRKLPPGRNFMVAAGLEQVLDFLENLQFSAEELSWLATRFRPPLIDYLERFHFIGDVHAMPEGTLFFPNEPILRITAPLPQAQLIESRIINILHFETLIASKAARSVLVAPGKLLVDFGMRRAHGAEAALLAARASYLAGFSGSATVLAGALYGIPLYGTMAHAYIQAHADESMAFEHFARSNPNNVVLLIDTYDTEAAAGKVVELAKRLQTEHIHIKGVRLDSGDLAAHAHNVRRILDQGGLQSTAIFASGNLDEYRLQTLLGSGAPIDGFGIGTALDVSIDAPALDCAYKLQEYAGKPRRKRSEGKATWPGRKQVYRYYAPQGEMSHDMVALEDSDPCEGEPLLVPMMLAGQRIHRTRPLQEIRQQTLARYVRLPESLTELETTTHYPVTISPALQALAKQLDDEAMTH